METDALSNADQPKPRPRWYQYTLRTLLIVVTLAGCGFGWLGLKVREARQQQADIAAIEELGGRVAFDDEVDSQGNSVPNAKPPGPVWLRAVLGDNFLRSVYSVDIEGQSLSDADLEHIRGLTTLKRLDVAGLRLTNAALRAS